MFTISFIRHRVFAAIRDEGGLWPAFKKAARLFRQRGIRHMLLGDGFPTQGDYRQWVQTVDNLTAADLASIRMRIAALAVRPVFSVLLPTHETPIRFLKSAVESVRSQLYPAWELCIADDASSSPSLHAYLETLKDDPRIRIIRRKVNGHIAACSNDALDLATGDWVVLLDHDDELSVDALYRFAEVIASRPDVRMLYSDEDKLDEKGRRVRPYFKPGFNRELLRGNNYICHLVGYRRAELVEIGGFREGFEGAQDHDLALRYSERCLASEIVHVPMVLYHWREHAGSTSTGMSIKSYALAAGKRAVEEHLARVGLDASVVANTRGYYDISYQLSGPEPSVAIIIPTRNQFELLRKCITSLRQKTSYGNYQILLVDNASDCPKVRAYLAQLDSSGVARVLQDAGPFNFSRLNNLAVRSAGTDFVLLMNNDIEVIEPNWLGDMIATAMQPDVGVVGAKLHYPDGTLQHAGIVLGIGGSAGHAFKHEGRDTLGYYFRAVVRSEFSALTGACMLVRRSVYEQAGGLDETRFGVAFNDVDLCLKVQDLGFRNVLCPGARLYHHESKSRGYEDTPQKMMRFGMERARLRQKWLGRIEQDPAYNINLTRDHENFAQAMGFSARTGKRPDGRPSPDDFDGLSLPPVAASASLIAQLKWLFTADTSGYGKVLCIGPELRDLAVAIQARRREAEVYLAIDGSAERDKLKGADLILVSVEDWTVLENGPIQLVIVSASRLQSDLPAARLVSALSELGGVVHIA